MGDPELRGLLLSHLYDLRDMNGGGVPVTDVIFSGAQAVSVDKIASVCRQLAGERLINWAPRGRNEATIIIGDAFISAHGIDVVEGTREPSINIRFPSWRDPFVLPEAQPETKPASTVAETTAEAGGAVQVSPLPGSPKGEMFILKPTLWGMSVDLKEVSRWLHRKWRRQA